MRRVVIAGVILAMLSLFNIYSLRLLNSNGQALLKNISEIEQQVDDATPQQLEKLCLELCDKWITTERVWSRLVRHDQLESITEVASRLPAMARWEERAELAAGLEEIEVLLISVLEFESPGLTGFL